MQLLHTAQRPTSSPSSTLPNEQQPTRVVAIGIGKVVITSFFLHDKERYMALGIQNFSSRPDLHKKIVELACLQVVEHTRGAYRNGRLPFICVFIKKSPERICAGLSTFFVEGAFDYASSLFGFGDDELAAFSLLIVKSTQSTSSSSTSSISL